MPSAAELPSGELMVAFQQAPKFAGYPIKGHVFIMKSGPDMKFEKPRLALDSMSCYQMNPIFLTQEDHLFLYFDCFDPKTNRSGFLRSKWQDPSFQKPDFLTVSDDSKLQYRNYTFPAVFFDGKVTITYEWRNNVDEGLSKEPKTRLQNNHLKVAYNTDNQHFGPSADLGTGVMIRSASFLDGTQIITYQNGLVDNMMDFFRLSSDLKSWTQPLAITDQIDVHDAIPFQRVDGNVDIYYLASQGGKNNIIYRRSITPQGVLGPIEQLTKPADGSFSQPHPLRRHDGTLFVALAKEIVNQDSYDIWALKISGDAALN